MGPEVRAFHAIELQRLFAFYEDSVRIWSSLPVKEGNREPRCRASLAGHHELL
jgi:hypothetical protein